MYAIYANDRTPRLDGQCDKRGEWGKPGHVHAFGSLLVLRLLCSCMLGPGIKDGKKIFGITNLCYLFLIFVGDNYLLRVVLKGLDDF